MVDLLGPAAFGAMRPSPARPVVVPLNALADPDTFAIDCTSPSAGDGTSLTAARDNALTAQMRRAIRGNAIMEDNTDDFMLARALRSQRSNAIVAAGTANAITLTPDMPFRTHAELIYVPLVFLVIAPNTAAVTLGVSGLASQPLTWPDGTALVQGDLAIGMLALVQHDGTAFRLQQCLSPTQVRGLVSANKSPTNLEPFSSRTRTIRAGIVGFIDFLTGTYTKKSATSRLVVSHLSNVFDGGTGANCSTARLTIAGTTVNAKLVSGTASINAAAGTANEVLTGVGAGVLPWALAHGRNDATPWTTRICPNSTDIASDPPSDRKSVV